MHASGLKMECFVYIYTVSAYFIYIHIHDVFEQLDCNAYHIYM